MEQKTGDDQAAQRKGTSTTKPEFSEALEDQDERGFDGVRQNRPEQDIGVTHTTREDAGVEEQGREPIQNREDSNQTGSESGEQPTEDRGVERVVGTGPGDSQPKERTGCNDVTVEGGRGSK